MVFNKWFVRINWITLVFIYLVVIAGSFVRITGSGMGCPDWPKCFGEWIPPTEASSLPADYKEIYVEKRAKKVEKFCTMLDGIGLSETAERIRSDESVLYEEDFNARKTWTEYINRLFGFLAGNGILLIFLWIILKYRRKKLVLVASINLFILLFQAWFGSIVVATNLVPWTITIHMLLALVIIGLQLYLIRLVSPSQQCNITVSKGFFWLVILILAITFYQMFLGTQVREEIDVLRKTGVERGEWSQHFDLAFYVHRSFSWLVLILITGMFWVKRNVRNLRIIHWIFIFLVIELTSGVLLAHFNMPGLVQTAHLLFACVIFGLLTMAAFRMKSQVSLKR
ncbi:MAG: COX15/CtaA family protein [Crocinitomicaceae bacterium]|nr:COX15/CtaA family protein [Crocinitomicaceae bacterium]